MSVRGLFCVNQDHKLTTQHFRRIDNQVGHKGYHSATVVTAICLFTMGYFPLTVVSGSFCFWSMQVILFTCQINVERCLEQAVLQLNMCPIRWLICDRNLYCCYLIMHYQKQVNHEQTFLFWRRAVCVARKAPYSTIEIFF